MIGIASLAGTAISAISGFFQRKQENKRAKQSAKAKLALARERGQQAVEMTQAEWEQAAAEAMKGSWKDEFLTLILAGPLLVMEIGVLLEGFTGDPTMREASEKMISSISMMDLDYATLLMVVVGASFGVRLVKR